MSCGNIEDVQRERTGERSAARAAIDVDHVARSMWKVKNEMPSGSGMCEHGNLPVQIGIEHDVDVIDDRNRDT